MRYPEGSGHHEPCMLLVEDEEIARTSLARLLGMQFPAVRLLSAADGVEGLELFRRHRPGLVITDVNMPRLNGLEMSRAILAEAPATRIIVLTAYSHAEYRKTASECGIEHYLVKPVDRHELFSAVHGWLAQHAG
ncbi:response regulator [Geomonas sp.]|uniref:response regulator n=1 Tax=Geomonas sp. TaxID=2651584 RepID=UPI002B4A103A|nr:response regulator [Geomonas sp.]HJV33943.1 response regulator [Geomonas sp.]